MGCDIHTRCERRRRENHGAQWETVEPDPSAFDCRDYSLFGWLANVRNYSAVPSISAERGVPTNVSDGARDYFDDYHSCSYVTIQELLDFDYSGIMEDRRVTRQTAPGVTSGSVTADQGNGESMSYAHFLGSWYFAELLRLRRLGVERVLFGFDS